MQQRGCGQWSALPARVDYWERKTAGNCSRSTNGYSGTDAEKRQGSCLPDPPYPHQLIRSVTSGMPSAKTRVEVHPVVMNLMVCT